MNGFEIQILEFIRNTFSCGFLDGFFKIYTNLGNAKMIIPMAIILIIFKKTRKTGIIAAIAIALGFCFSNILLKNIFERVRPYDFNAVKLIVPAEHDTSFPSGHCTAIFALATSVFLNNKKAVGIAAIVLASLVAFSRLYLYVHYPSDVLVGTLIGILAAIAAKYIADKLERKYPKLF